MESCGAAVTTVANYNVDAILVTKDDLQLRAEPFIRVKEKTLDYAISKNDNGVFRLIRRAGSFDEALGVCFHQYGLFTKAPFRSST